MRWLLARLRFCGVIASMAFLVIGAFVCCGISRKLVLGKFRVLWAKSLICSTGAKLNVTGYTVSKDELRNAMIISNHISWLDTVVMLRLFFVRYVGKVEMLRWPILSSLIKIGGTIFIDRKHKKDIIKVNQQVANLLCEGATIGLYPEGKTTPGHAVQVFKAPILEAALIAKSTIIPMVLSYRKENNQLATEVSFAGVNWITTVMNTLMLKNLQINVTVLSPVHAGEFATREDLNAHLYKIVNDCYLSQQ